MIDKLTEIQKKKIDNIFKKWDNKDTPGCILGVVKDKKLIYGRGYGMADLEHDIPNSIDSVLNIGSVTKQFTAACIHILAAKKKLSLDDTLSKYFPEFPKYATKITLKHLLYHTSGIRDYGTLLYFTEKGSVGNNDYDILYLLKKQKNLNYQPGKRFLYSNSGYWLLGKIVEIVTNMNLQDFADKNIFKPLRMKNTFFHNNRHKIIKNRVFSYKPNENDFDIFFNNGEDIGAGGIFSTVEDLLKWDTNFYNPKIGNSKFTINMERQGVLNSGQETHYASGLNIFFHKGLKLVTHGGYFNGYKTEIMRVPDQKFSIIIMANRQDIDPYSLCTSMLDIFFKEYYSKDNSKKKSKTIEMPKKVAISNKKIKEFCGTYWYVKDCLSRKVYFKDGSLWYFRYEGSENELMHIGGNEFIMLKNTVDLRMTFGRNRNNEKTISMIMNNGLPDGFTCFSTPKYTKKELYQFCGKYYSKELGKYYSIKREDKELFLFDKDQRIEKIIKVKRNIFNLWNFANFEFIKFKDNKFNGFLLSTERFFNVKFERIK